MISARLKSEVITLCKVGYATGDRSIYDKIDGVLAEVEQTEQVQALRRLALGGKSLTSPRFAFPHIEDRMVRD